MYHFLWFLPAGLKTKTMSQMHQHLFILALKTLSSQAASPSLPYTHTRVLACVLGIKCLCKYLQDVPHLSETIISMPRISLITKHSANTHRLFQGSFTKHLLE